MWLQHGISTWNGVDNVAEIVAGWGVGGWREKPRDVLHSPGREGTQEPRTLLGTQVTSSVTGSQRQSWDSKTHKPWIREGLCRPPLS